jgi:hypothetical protein
MSNADKAAPARRVTITLTIDEAAAIVLATIIRGLAPEDRVPR